MAHPLIVLYNAQITKYQNAIANDTAGIQRLKAKAGDHTAAIEHTAHAHSIASEKLASLLRQREAMVRDLEALDRLREMSRHLMSWRDTLESDAKNPKLPDAQRHFSAATAARVNVLLLGGKP